MSTVYIIKFILTGIIVIVLLVAISKRQAVEKEKDEYSEDVLQKAKEYRESGEAERFKKQVEDAELNEFLNQGYDD